MISFPKHAFQYFLLCVIGLVLVGCGGSSTIGNGANLANLSGAANSQKTYSIKLPDNTVSLIIQAAGSPDITLDLLDANGNSLGACTQPLFCVLDTPAAGTYKLRLKATAAYAGVNLSASWGGPGVSVLQNNLALGGLSGNATTVLLKSLYLEPDPVALLLELAGTNNSNIELLDRYGNSLWLCAPTNCLVKSIEAGLYFVRLQGTGTFADTSLKARWGDSFGVTLENGVPRTGLTGTAGSPFVESFLLPEGADSVLLATSKPGMALQLVSADDHPVWFNCQLGAGHNCIARDVPPGLYYVVGSFYQDVENFSLALRFGGAGYSSLENGQSSEPQPANPGALYVESFYVEEGVTSAAFVSSWNAAVRVYDASGISVCEFQPCIMSNLQPGAYFATVTVVDDSLTTSVSSSVAMGGPATGTLVNGQTKEGTLAFPMASKVESFYAGPGVDSFAVAVSGNDVYVRVTDQQGMVIAWCYTSEPCVARINSPGAYFVFHDAGPTATIGEAFSLALALGGEHQSTLESGESTEPQPARTNDVYVESFYVGEGITSAGFVSTLSMEARIYDASGSVVCNWQPCILTNLQPGSYFAVMRVSDDQWMPTVNASLALAGPGEATLVSGQTKQNVVDFANQSKVDSFFAAPGVDSFAVAVSGNDVYVRVTDQQGMVIAWCYTSEPCVARINSPGAYFVFHDAGPTATIGEAFSLALALGGEHQSTLESGESTDPQPARTNDVYVESFYVGEGVTGAGFVSTMNMEARIYDANGNAVCSWQPCILANLQPGSYFAVMRVSDDQWMPTVNASLALAGPGEATLVSGQTKQNVVDFASQNKIESFFAAPGVDSFAVAISGNDVYVRVTDQQGVVIAWCYTSEPCVARINSPGAYFVFHEAGAAATIGEAYSLALALGGEHQSTLESGESTEPQPARTNDVYVESFHVGEGITGAGFVSTMNMETRVYNANGSIVCAWQPCILTNLQPGSYFAVMRVYDDQWMPTVNASLALAGPSEATLVSGQTKPLTVTFNGQSGIESFYAAPGVDSVALAVKGSNAWVNIIGPQGSEVIGCDTSSPCIARLNSPGVHFVRMDYDSGVTSGEQYSIAMALGGENHSTLKADTIQPVKAATPDTTFVQSFYRTSLESFTGFAGSRNTISRIYNSDGELVCTGNFCSLRAEAEGTYFAFSDVLELAAGQNTGFASFALAEVSAQNWTLHNGETLQGLQGRNGELLLKAIFIPENTAFPGGVDSMLIAPSTPAAAVSVYDVLGRYVNTCFSFDLCLVADAGSEIYFVLLEFLEFENPKTTDISAAWVGSNVASLQKGITYEIGAYEQYVSVVHSFKLDDNSDVALSVVGPGMYSDIVTAEGVPVADCFGSCEIPALVPGLYFLRLRTGQATPGERITFNLAW